MTINRRIMIGSGRWVEWWSRWMELESVSVGVDEWD